MANRKSNVWFYSAAFVYALLVCVVCARCAEPVDYPASVRIDTPTSRSRVTTCSGTLFHKTAGEVFGLTAAHCFEEGDVLTIYMADGSEHKANVIKRFNADDLLLFSFKTGDTSNVPVTPIATDMDGKKFYAIGFPGGQNKPARIELTLDYKGDGISKSDSRRFDWFNVCNGRFSWGSSGGGVFSDGKLMGVIARCDGKKFRQLGASSITDVKEFLSKTSCSIFNVRGQLTDRQQTEIIRELQAKIKELSSTPNDGENGDKGGDAANTSVLDEQSSRLNRLEDSLRDFRANLLRDVAALVAKELAAVTPRAPVPARAVPDRANMDVESRVEVILEAQERIERDKAKLLSELRRRSEQFDRLADQLDVKAKG